MHLKQCLAVAAWVGLSWMSGPVLAQSAVSTAGSEAAAPARALSTQGNEGAAPAAAVSTRDAASPDAVRAAFGERFPGIEVSSVERTPFPGLFEVRIGMDFVYTDAQVEYILQGSLIDAKSRRDLTAERSEELSRVAFADLPLELAIKQVKGDGSRRMAVFEDPNCGYCKRLHQTLKEVDNTTVYTFLFPILSPDSSVKARNIWCAKDRAATWRAWILDGKTPPEAQCDTPIDTVLALGRKLMVQGTPAIIFADGSRVNGALPLDALQKKLDAL
ncbi:DsbC family protein [Parapusillimonas granuli]|uniref:Thiol:disulfide interchange protein n=1 Tax=Parapusillimonas granuli TaxID=380911 RepID=A0A853G4I2_9BURK|nr:DsbC family protein [Parapusillimonas granuli]MBB5215423.1 thiol:disulfide interchange protein DsbC [Parapusillimonas granuli]NYT49910.1 DsbC family protein [Parapusillimonas granuli]